MLFKGKAMNRLLALTAVAAFGAVLAACGSSGAPSSSGASSTSGGGAASTPVASLPATGAVTTQPTVTVTGTGSVTAQPDSVVITLGVTMTGVTTSDAIDAAQGASAKLVSSLTGSGVARADIATTQYSINEHWNQTLQRNDGWEVRNGVTAVLRDITKVGSVVGNAATALPNVLWVQSIDFRRNDVSAIAGPARDAAMKDARAHAASWAQLAGRTLGDVVSVSEASSSTSYTMPGQSAGGMGGGAGVVTGNGLYTVTVTVVFAAS
ncbi:MAG TPA: SIMPL domain-containing protein [Candidatus Dormibacteraeota bacterium]|nr:SIMPL domain-containing protein [Candidatus Dormibacteraeota bacterium]